MGLLLKSPRSVCTVHHTLKPLCKTCIFCAQHFHRSPPQLLCDSNCEYDAHQSGHYSGTMFDVIKVMKESFGLETGYHTMPKCRAALLKYQPKLEDLPTRSMKDSSTTALLTLSSASIRGYYISHVGLVRLGRLLEEIDMFAVWICYRHVFIPTLPKGIPMPYIFATVQVDRVDFVPVNEISSTDDINLSGHVSWTGNSSMEVKIYLRQKMRIISKAIMVMVARNATNTGPCPVNALKPTNEKEQQCYEESVKRHNLRMAKKLKSVLNVRPNQSDEILMYEIFKRTKGDTALKGEFRKLPPNCCWMSDYFQSTMLHAFPENRNLLNQLFGGFVMRVAVEISYIAATIYAGSEPTMTCIQDVSFQRPMNVNSFLKVTAYIVYTYKDFIQLVTIVQVIDANNMEPGPAIALYSTFKAAKDVKEVLPFTYQETLWYINGRNKFLSFRNLKNQRNQKSKTGSKKE